MDPCRYNSLFLGTAAALLLPLGLTNLVIDPLGLNYFVTAEFNAIKTELNTFSAVAKVYAIRRVKPRGIVLGNSRTEGGIDPDHPGWSSETRPVYNAAFPGSNIYMVLQFLEHANEIHHTKQAVIGLDLSMFNVNVPAPAEVVDSVLEDGHSHRLVPLPFFHHLNTMFAWDTLQLSIRTVQHQGTRQVYFLPNGRVKPEVFLKALQDTNGHRGGFQVQDSNYRLYFPLPQGQYAFRDRAGRSSLKHFGQIVHFAREQGIDLRLFISPSHARQWEFIRVIGLWPEFEQWKRELVAILEEDARTHPGHSPFPLWDFSGYNAITCEPVPPLGDVTTRMVWYWESSHYTKDLGDLVLDRMFSRSDAFQRGPKDLGVVLTSKNIDAHQLRLREKQQEYQQSHPVDVVEVERLTLAATESIPHLARPLSLAMVQARRGDMSSLAKSHLEPL